MPTFADLLRWAAGVAFLLALAWVIGEVWRVGL